MLVFLLSFISEWFHAFFLQVGEYQKESHTAQGWELAATNTPRAHLSCPNTPISIFLLFYKGFLLLNSEQEFLNVEYSIVIYSISWIQQWLGSESKTNLQVTLSLSFSAPCCKILSSTEWNKLRLKGWKTTAVEDATSMQHLILKTSMIWPELNSQACPLAPLHHTSTPQFSLLLIMSWKVVKKM